MIVIRTEQWSTKQGNVVKAVTRDERGRLLGPTNQTKAIRIEKVVGK